MKEMLVILAKNLSSDQVLERLQEHIDLYKEAKLLNKDVEEAKHHLMMFCQVYLIHHMPGDALDILKQIHQSEKANNFFQTGQN